MSEYKTKLERDDEAKATKLAEAQARIAELESERQNWRISSVCVEYRKQRDDLLSALRRSMTALDDWLHVHAPNLCSQEYVKESHERIWNAGATLSYIAGIQDQNRAAIARCEKEMP